MHDCTSAAFESLMKFCKVPGEHVQLCQGLSRGIATSRAVRSGEVVFGLPWKLALTPETAVLGLAVDEGRKQGLLPGGISQQLHSITQAAVPEVAASSKWILLLVLHLLRELRDPKSAHRHYVEMLPAPPGSLVKAVCCSGPDGTDLLLFNDAELLELQNDRLAADVMAERARIISLHQKLFGTTGECPAISLESFLWAHTLVRSRSLDLTGHKEGASGEPFRARCLLPLIDLCNHSGQDATCTLALRLAPGGEPKWVEVVARRALEAGEELLLDYGQRSQRDFLQGYAFTPPDNPHEVFGDIGGRWESLYVRGSPQGRMLWLSGVHLSGKEGCREGGITYIAHDDCTVAPSAAAAGALLSLPDILPVENRRLGAQQEAVLAAHVADEAVQLLERLPTTLAQDMQLLEDLEGRTPGGAAAPNKEPKDRVSGTETRSCVPHAAGLSPWHAVLALKYRLYRKALLKRIGRDLQAQAALLGERVPVQEPP